MPKHQSSSSATGYNKYQSAKNSQYNAQSQGEYQDNRQQRAPYNRDSNRDNKKKKNDKEPTEYRLPKGLSKCKNEIRSLNRLLSSSQLMPSTKRLELERRLKALTLRQTQLSSSKVDKTNASRYHGVKFIERKKILRRLAQIDKKPEEQQVEFEQEKKNLLVDLNYTSYYPDQVKYISLFPAEPEKTSKETKERQGVIREAIREAMEKGKLPKDARDVKADDRKAIRRNNRLLLKSVSLAHGLEHKDGDDSAESDGERSEAENNDGGADGTTTIEEDEFFA
ncbi:18S rRNA maturation protein [Coemansia sp. IMI 203386]|nr:18S rRNA maturation protein [Coemansia sp. IMI 203386]